MTPHAAIGRKTNTTNNLHKPTLEQAPSAHVYIITDESSAIYAHVPMGTPEGERCQTPSCQACAGWVEPRMLCKAEVELEHPRLMG